MSLLKAARSLLFENKVPAVGLGLFRIAYGSVLLGEVLQLIYFRRLVFGDLAFLPAPESNFAFVLWAWAATVICLTLGLYTRIACVVNYVLTLATLSTFQHYEYHADHIYIGVNLLLIFTPVENRLSLDSLLRKIRSGVLPGAPPPDTSVARFHYDAILLLALGLVYFDSFFWKLGQEMWGSGLGVWLPASLPHDTWFSPTILNAVLNRRVLMGVLSDLTLVFEATFIALMWFHAARPILFVIGLGLHLSIVFAFPIPFFGLSLSAIYLLLAPAGWYQAIARRIRRSAPVCVVFFPAHSSAWRRALLVLEHFDFRGCLEFRPVTESLKENLLVVENHRQYAGSEGLTAALRCHPAFWPVAWLYAAGAGFMGNTRRDELHRLQTSRIVQPVDLQRLVVASSVACPLPAESPQQGALNGGLRFKFALVALCVVVQSTLISKAPYFRDENTQQSSTPRWLAQLQRAAYGYAGVCSHGVFLDHHFKNYDHAVAVTWVRPDGGESWLPLTRPNGQMGWYATGRFWCKWAFRGNGPYISLEHLTQTLRDVTGFWARKNRVDLTDAHFKVLFRKYDPQNGWQRDFLLSQTAKPWSAAGTLRWKNGRFSAEIANLEAQ